MKSVRLWLIPGGLVSVLCLSVALGLGPASLNGVFAGWFPGAVQAGVMALATYFHRSRVFLFALGLGFIHVAFTGKTLQEALPHLREVRRSVEDPAFLLRSWRRPRKRPVDPGAWRGAGNQGPKRLSVTISVGVADTTGGDRSPEAVLKRADRALYRAKEDGRNRVAK